MTQLVFNTYDDLIAAAPSAGDTAVLLGYAWKGDGGGGDLIWDSASTATPHTSIIIQRAAGGTGRWFRLFDEQDGPVNIRWFGALGDSVTDDKAAIDAAIAYCVARSRTLGFPDGTYAHAGAINWAFNHLHVMALGDDVVFLHTGTGVAHSFSGIANYPGTQGCVGGVFGGPGRIMLKGNLAGTTTRVIDLDNWHQGYMKVALHDGQTAFYGNDTGGVGSSAVETTFDLRITSQDGPWAHQPGHGVDFTKPVACIFEKLIVENVGNGGVTAVALTGAANNLFRGGTVEGNLGSGITEDSTCSHNTYIQLANEANGGTNDWILSGTAPVLINCNGGGANGCLFNSTSATLIGGVFYNVVINDNNLWSNSTEFHGSFTNNGTHTTIINPQGGVATAVESAATVLQSKTFDTANANTLKINSNTVNAVTGTGSTVALSAAPRFTGQVEIGANVAPDSTLTVNNNTGAAVAPSLPRELHLIGADAAFSGVLSDNYGSEGLYLARAADGTQASKIAIGPHTSYFAIGGQTWDGSAYTSNIAIEFMTVNTQTGSDHSSRVRIKTVPAGSTTVQEVVSFGSGVSVGTTTDYGLQNLLVAGSVSTASPVTLTGTSGSAGATDSSIIVNASGTFTLTLPPAASYSGRWLSLKSIAAQTVNSASSNVVPLAGGASGTALLTAAAGKWANLQSDGTNWIVMSAN